VPSTHHSVKSRLVIRDEKTDVADWAAKYVVTRINGFEKARRAGQTSKRHFVLGLPTGSTPLGMYKVLVRMVQAGEVSFENVITFNMDEYVFPETTPDRPCAKNPNSYHHYMWHNFFQHIDIKPENVHILDGDLKFGMGEGEDMQRIVEECRRYEELIKELGGIDLFLGGIGPDGHIAFNEPGSSLQSRTRVKTLNEETVFANQQHFIPVRWDENAVDELSLVLEQSGNQGCNPRGTVRFASNNAPKTAKSSIRKIAKRGAWVEAKGQTQPKVPMQALTVGVQTVMDAKEVMILVTGQPKALALSKCIEEGVSHQWTVSMVQLHPHAVVVCDESATAEMRVKTVKYYNGLEKVHNSLLGKYNPDSDSAYESEETIAGKKKTIKKAIKKRTPAKKTPVKKATTKKRTTTKKVK
jgi:glucosamine-6-phosphate deaminase